MYELFRAYGGEKGLEEAFAKNPRGLTPIINQELDGFQQAIADRDHAYRRYISKLRTLLGLDGTRIFTEHEESMRKALAALKQKR